jgi:2-dehydropantoate 2-reductase
MMRLLVVGAGAIGGFLAARLADAGHAVTVVARGPHLEAIRTRGISLTGTDGSRLRASVRAVAGLEELAAAGVPSFDVVFVCLKAQQVLQVLAALAKVALQAGLLVPVHNGVGWWYFQGLAGPFAGEPVRAIDPDGLMVASLPVDRTVPMFAFKAARVTSPGMVEHNVAATDSFPAGELDGTRTPRLQALVELLTSAGLRTQIGDVRSLMWSKLLGNVYANPISALTGATVGEIAADPSTRALAIDLMGECAAIATGHQVRIPVSFDERLARAAEVASARPSMLQDRDAGKPMEIEPILGALIELGQRVGIQAPHVSALLACLRLIEARRLSAADPLPMSPGGGHVA